jgi:diguanylate cyclase (GGDEF)-like protein
MNKKQVKILLVDDDPADRKLAQLALKSGLHTVEFVTDIADTLTQAMLSLKKGGIDLVLLDLGLPDSNGIETVDRLRDAHPNIPIIVLTGLSDEEIGVEAIRRGAVDYVTKPFKPSGLRTRIGIALQIVELQKKLLLLANTDELTGLANRRHFFDILDREILRAKIDGSSLAVMMLDIDHFKSANDTYGHRGGDEILAQMGKILNENIYPLDVAARYGGEEFIILMPNTSPEKAYQAAERLRKIVDQYRWKVLDKTISITTSIGLASVDSNNLMSSYDLAEKADTALYNAKRRGRNCVVRWENVNSAQEPEQPDDRVYHELQNKVASLTRKLRSHAVGTISAFSRAMDMIFKDQYIVRHGENVQTYAIAIAEEMGLSSELVERIGTSALLQDVGSITIPESILKKTTPLTKEEKRIIKQHPNASVEILEPVGIFGLELQIIKGHHERFDGAGYPNGLKGREIPIGSRILAVADAFDAITSHREHRQARPVEEAIEEIVKCSGTQFDPDVVEALQKVLKGPLAMKKNAVAVK